MDRSRAILWGPLALAVACASLALTGCGTRDAGLEWTGTVTDSAGIQLVHNPARGLWRPGEEWRFDEDLRIGRVEGAPELQFGEIIGLDVDPDGNIYILDRQAQQLRVFSPVGEHLRTLGGPGAGPGELSPHTQAVIVGTARVARVIDPGNARVTRFGPGGDYIGEFRDDVTGGAAIRWDANASGQLVAQLRGLSGQGLEAHPGGDPLVIYDSDGAEVDTLCVLPNVRAAEMTIFGPEPLWDLSPHLLVTAATTMYRLDIRDGNGRAIRVITREVERRPVGEADRLLHRRMISRQFVEGFGMAPGSAARIVDRLPFADFYPAIASVILGPRGSIMAQRVHTASDPGAGSADFQPNAMGVVGAREWDVFDDRGRYLGAVTFPARFEPLTVVNDLIYGIWRNELDVQFVIRLRPDISAS